MRRQRVKLSEVRSVGYDVPTSVLEAEFQSGEIYQYFDVPADIALELLEHFRYWCSPPKSCSCGFSLRKATPSDIPQDTVLPKML